MRTAPTNNVKELTDQMCVHVVKPTMRTGRSVYRDLQMWGYISVISTSVRLVQKKSSKQATLGWARRESKSLSWKALVRVLLRRGRNLAAKTSPVLLWITRFTTPKVPLNHRKMILWDISRCLMGNLDIKMMIFTFRSPRGHHIQRITFFSSPALPHAPEAQVDLKKKNTTYN